ncbi:MAG TPA: SRPBCC family protein [Bryobacteraceae bacterium]|nr:SRPBCC family protein [Bryobacteraceae bacterium]
MKWILWIVGGLVLLVGLMAGVGALLPERHHGTRKARYRVAPDALYAVLAGPPDWRTGVKSFGVLPEQNGRRQWWEEDTHRQKITYELVEAKPPERLAVRIAGEGLPFGGTWTFRIAPVAGGGSELRIDEDGEIYNVIFRFMARFFFGYTASIDGYLRDLGAKFGEAVSIEA